MRIRDLDYYSTHGTSRLNRMPVKIKLFFALLILISVIASSNYIALGGLYAFLLTIILFSKTPKFKIIVLSLYPLLFIALYIFALKSISYSIVLLIMFKALCASTAFVLLIFTTSYKDIFMELDKFLPSILVSTLFLTYRSVFILWTILENLKLAMYIRGELSIKRPLFSLKKLGGAIGYLLIRAIEISEHMYEGLILRGYSGNFRYLRK